jgi:hypothetical protein
MNTPATTFEKSSARVILVLMGGTLLYFALRVYNDFATTGTIQIATWIVESFPHARGVYPALSVLLDIPFVVVYSFTVALALAVFLERGLWKYALVIGVVSEVAWIVVWRSFIWGRSPSELTNNVPLLRSIVFAVGPPIAAYLVEKAFNAWTHRIQGGNTQKWNIPTSSAS